MLVKFVKRKMRMTQIPALFTYFFLLVPGIAPQLISEVTFEKLLVQMSGAFSYITDRETLDYPIAQEVQFNLYTRKNPQIPQVIPMHPSLLRLSNFNFTAKTYFVIHGYTDHKHREIIALLRNALVRSENANVIVVDWRRLAGLIYVTAVACTIRVGNYLGEFLWMLQHEVEYDLNDVHLIGHSLGAHISGIAGAYVGGRVGRITGLDPAGPLFEFIEVKNESESLDRGDAVFVDVIHTNGEEFGTTLPQGDADFYPNGGLSPQPGCDFFFTVVSCSHIRAVDFYTESITGSIPFEARHCDASVEGDECLSETPVHMGHYLSREARGVYYVETNAQPPYAIRK